MTPLEIFVTILITVAIISCIIMIIGSINDEDYTVLKFSIILAALLICVGVSLIAIRNNNIEEQKFHLKNYNLEYEIITRGEESDTLYVLTRKFQK